MIIIYMFITLAFWSFSVCGIFRSPWIRICISLVAMWAGLDHFHHREISMQWLCFTTLFGQLLPPHFLPTSLLHFSRHVSHKFPTYRSKEIITWSRITIISRNAHVTHNLVLLTLSRKLKNCRMDIYLYYYIHVVVLDHVIISLQFNQCY